MGRWEKWKRRRGGGATLENTRKMRGIRSERRRGGRERWVEAEKPGEGRKENERGKKGRLEN